MRASLLRKVLLLVLVAWTGSAPAALIYDYSDDGRTPVGIPDNDANGLAFKFSLTDSATSISSVTVALNVSGGHNGDLYVYLSHGSGFAVLLNRIGRTAGNSMGSASSGFNVTFSHTGANGDIHSAATAAGSQVTGAWQPDARAEDPATVLDTSTRSALLTSFNTLNPNGDWTLFIADMSSGSTATLNDFTVTVTAVPEPVSSALALFGCFAAASWTVRAMRSRRKGA